MAQQMPPHRREPVSQALVAAAVKAVANTCLERGLHFTTIRRQVMETLIRAGQPLGAYELMPALERTLGRRLTPPTVYRALEFLQEQHFVSRIESRNAFVPCAHPNHPHACVFFICDNCGASAEVEDSTIEKAVARDAASLGFRIARRVVELQGTCATCIATGSHATAHHP
ncbi:Fur family transcriptional regulator [Mesorhizobium sp. VK22B]|uniref:Fur family transcriptional regulator n=1 Tax=Mesorhizobium captivum TaxID=3072319 RepID=A0ABU4Z7S1_9HYPH|nr:MULTISPECIES: Fur family transcriptional regulator [unclassified Mesorhizobium]MDX8495313.1 Fur family transcriptional regulator [Mesorhizobium sp. VK22B]MDX8508720.1 Fur family transcriptional regulator [Mesorhizobium sp. VK22E]